jgi:hypothetical protein
MSVLTENVVLSRTRSQDLRSVKKLNCWGSELRDVSIVRRLPSVEVLSLSINHITTLADFAACKMLQELYLRKNKINDINELLYLIELPDLKKLWLAENPCAEFDNYRMTVLKALPNLEFLDNIRVTPEEIIRAEREGFDLIWPQSDNEENEEFNQQIISTQESQLAAVVPTLPQSSTQTYQQQSQPSQQELQQQMLITGNALPTPSSATYDPPQPLFQYPCDANASGYTASSAYQNTPTISSSRINSASNGNLSQQSQRLLPKGGKNRNANILSAVLCLIKELDYASLEVVDTTIHCRMEEMED